MSGGTSRRWWWALAAAGAVALVAVTGLALRPAGSDVAAPPTGTPPASTPPAGASTTPGVSPSMSAASGGSGSPASDGTATPNPYQHTFAQQPGVPALPPQPSPTAGYPVPVAVSGCDPGYGAPGQCVPVHFPPYVADNPADRCAWLARQGLLPLAVVGADRHGLDPDANGIACD
jgi:hypothetical protein